MNNKYNKSFQLPVYAHCVILPISACPTPANLPQWANGTDGHLSISRYTHVSADIPAQYNAVSYKSSFCNQLLQKLKTAVAVRCFIGTPSRVCVMVRCLSVHFCGFASVGLADMRCLSLAAWLASKCGQCPAFSVYVVAEHRLAVKSWQKTRS